MEKDVFFLIIVVLLMFLVPSTAASLNVGFDDDEIPSVRMGISKIIDMFLELEDTPSTYTGAADLCVRVNAGEDALTFGVCGNVSGGGNVTQLNYVQSFQSNFSLNFSGESSYLNSTYALADNQWLFNQSDLTYNFNQSDLTYNFNQSDLGSVYIPYTGATTNIDLGTKNITTTGFGQFAWTDLLEITEPDTPPANTLRLYVIEQDGFSRINYKDELGVSRTINDDEIIVNNSRGSTIAAHRLVYVTGYDSGVPTIDLAQADSLSTMPSICVTIESIADGQYGRCMMSGLIENVNTNTFDIGTIYVSATTAGIPTNTAPVTPNLTQEIGNILVKDVAVGQIQILARALTGDEFGTINNFIISGNLSSLGSYHELSNIINFTDTLWINGVNVSTWLFNQSDLKFNFNQSDLDLVYAKIGTGGNLSWNESYADSLYSNFTWAFNQSDLTYNFNQSDLDLVYAPVGGGGNASWNQSFANTLYAGPPSAYFNITDYVANDLGWLEVNKTVVGTANVTLSYLI